MSEMTKELLLERIPCLDEAKADKFIKYYKMLIDWNERINLTRIVEPVEVIEKHFLDSLLGSELIPENAKVVDVGTGAGFPGIPLAIVRPDIELTLVDSLGKRVNFLNEVCENVGVPAAAIHARAEDAARDAKLRESFDIALSRAVAPMNVLLELTVPFIKVGGASLMYKAAGVDEELESSKKASEILKCRLTARYFDVPWGARSIVSAVKTGATPAKYPRKAGTAQKNPL